MFEHIDLEEKNVCVDIKKKAQTMLKKIMETQKKIIDAKGTDKAPKILIIFEDIQSDARFMRSSEFLKCFLMNRHYGLSVWLCGQ